MNAIATINVTQTYLVTTRQTNKSKFSASKLKHVCILHTVKINYLLGGLVSQTKWNYISPQARVN